MKKIKILKYDQRYLIIMPYGEFNNLYLIIPELGKRFMYMTK